MLIKILYSSIVISGRLVPVFQDGEDIIAIPLSIIQKQSGVTILKDEVKTATGWVRNSSWSLPRRELALHFRKSFFSPRD